MRRSDELHLDYPFAGSRMLRDLLGREGLAVGRLHVSTLMKRIGIEAIYRRPKTSKPAPGHKVYPYLLRKLAVTRPNQVWAIDITYIPTARGFVYLAALDQHGRQRGMARQCLRRAALAVHQIRGSLPARYDTVSDARNSIGKYLAFYNGRRPHSSLGRRPPDEAYFNALMPILAAA